MKKNFDIIRTIETSPSWRLKIAFLILSFVLIKNDAYSQYGPGFAGEDKSVYFDFYLGKTDVRLGKSDSSKDIYYKWNLLEKPEFGDCEIDDVFSSNPLVTIHVPGEYVFQCTQISKYGYKNEYVIVKATSRVDILDVKLKPSKCFFNGSTVAREDFEFVTDPPGCEEHIIISEETEVINEEINTVWPIFVHEVRFMAIDENDDYYESDVTCKIPVIDDEKMVNHKDIYWDMSGNEMPIDVEENVELARETIGGLNRLNCYTTPSYLLPPAIYTMVNPGGVGTSLTSGIAVYNYIKTVVDVLDIVPVTPSFSYTSQFNQLGLKLKCDNGNIYPEVYFSGKLSASFSIGVDAPLASFYGLNLYLSGSLGLNFEIEKTDGAPLNPQGNDIKIPAKFIPNIYIGATVAILNPSIVSASAGIQFDFNIETYLNFNSMMRADEELCPDCWEMAENGLEYDDFHFTIWLKSTTTMMSFQTSEHTFKLCEIQSINQLTF